MPEGHDSRRSSHAAPALSRAQTKTIGQIIHRSLEREKLEDYRRRKETQLAKQKAEASQRTLALQAPGQESRAGPAREGTVDGAPSDLAVQVQVIDGVIQVDQSRLHVEVQANREEYRHATDDSLRLNQHTYAVRDYAAKWTERDTELFFKAIEQFGTDFSLMAQLFPGRTRAHIKRKYLKEKRVNRARMDAAMEATVLSTEEESCARMQFLIDTLRAARLEQEAGRAVDPEMRGLPSPGGGVGDALARAWAGDEGGDTQQGADEVGQRRPQLDDEDDSFAQRRREEAGRAQAPVPITDGNIDDVSSGGRSGALVTMAGKSFFATPRIPVSIPMAPPSVLSEWLRYRRANPLNWSTARQRATAPSQDPGPRPRGRPRKGQGNPSGRPDHADDSTSEDRDDIDLGRTTPPPPVRQTRSGRVVSKPAAARSARAAEAPSPGGDDADRLVTGAPSANTSDGAAGAPAQTGRRERAALGKRKPAEAPVLRRSTRRI